MIHDLSYADTTTHQFILYWMVSGWSPDFWWYSRATRNVCMDACECSLVLISVGWGIAKSQGKSLLRCGKGLTIFPSRWTSLSFDMDCWMKTWIVLCSCPHLVLSRLLISRHLGCCAVTSHDVDLRCLSGSWCKNYFLSLLAYWLLLWWSWSSLFYHLSLSLIGVSVNGL